MRHHTDTTILLPLLLFSPAAEVPVNYPIAQHLEMSFLPAPPRQLFFGCLKAVDGDGR